MALRALGVIAVLVVAACATSPTSPLIITEHQEEWLARRPAAYEFDYAVQVAILYPSCPSAAWRVTVQGGTATGAMCIADNQPVTGVTASVDSVFAHVLRAVTGGRGITQIQYDPTYGYPASVTVDGPPDAGWSESVSNLHPLATPVARP